MDISSLLIIRTVHTVLNYSRLSVLRTKYLVCGQTLNGFTSFVNPFESKSGQEQENDGATERRGTQRTNVRNRICNNGYQSLKEVCIHGSSSIIN